MLSQNDVVAFLAKQPPQHVAFQILSAYIYSKSSRGNLPSETLAKILTISHKLALVKGPIQPGSPVARAFEAAKTALIMANRHWISQGPRALGPLGQIGSASTPDAIAAWTKATDGKVRQFDNGEGAALHHGPAVDAGRLVGPRHGGVPEMAEPPPMYEAPPGEAEAEAEAEVRTGTGSLVGGAGGTEAAAEAVVQEGREAVATHETSGVREAVREAVAASPSNGAAGGQVAKGSAGTGGGAGRSQAEIDLEQGRANLARLRQALLEKEQAEEVGSHQPSQRAPDHEGLESDVSTPDRGQTPPPRI